MSNLKEQERWRSECWKVINEERQRYKNRGAAAERRRKIQAEILQKLESLPKM